MSNDQQFTLFVGAKLVKPLIWFMNQIGYLIYLLADTFAYCFTFLLFIPVCKERRNLQIVEPLVTPCISWPPNIYPIYHSLIPIFFCAAMQMARGVRKDFAERSYV